MALISSIEHGRRVDDKDTSSASSRHWLIAGRLTCRITKMDNKILWFSVLAVAILVGVLTWLSLSSGGGINGTWTLAEGVEINLNRGGQYSVITQINGVNSEAARGSFEYDSESGTANFDLGGNESINWTDVEVAGNELSFLINGNPMTISRVETALARAISDRSSSDPMVAVFPFEQTLVEQLSQDGNFVGLWSGLSGFRRTNDDFSGATLFEAVDSEETFPFITIDRWGSQEAFEAFSRAFSTDAMQTNASYITEGPGMYRVADQRGDSAAAQQGEISSLVFIEVPDDLRDTYMSQWEILADFVENQEGFLASTLYRSIDGSESRYDYLVQTMWESEESSSIIDQSEFVQAVVGEGTYTGLAALYRVAAEDVE